MFLLQSAASHKINSLNCSEATIEEILLGGQTATAQTSSGPVSQSPVIHPPSTHCRCYELISNSLQSYFMQSNRCDYISLTLSFYRTLYPHQKCIYDGPFPTPSAATVKVTSPRLSQRQSKRLMFEIYSFSS